MSLDVYLGVDGVEVFEANVTHNLGGMAAVAGIYEIVWRPDEAGIESAGQLIEPLERAIAEMKADPGRFQAYNPKNGWGSYSGFIPWLERYLEACRKFPHAQIRARR